MIAFLNKWFRPPRVEGRESQEAYSEWERQWGTELVRAYLEPAGDLEGKRILDVGCGLGGKTVSYGEGGASAVFGVDISIDYTASSVSYAEKGAFSFVWAFFAGDASQLPVADNTFDTVVGNDTMEHLARPEQALSEMVRIAKPGGAIWIFFTPFFSPLGSHLYDYIYIPWCHLLFSRRQLRRAIARLAAKRRPGVSPEESDSEADRVMRSFEEDLNRMSVRRFFKMVKRCPLLRLTYKELKPAKYSFLKVFTHIPLVRELVTGSVICRLEKRG